jgi:GTPase Era involved in 16S rRNA processing
VHHQGEPTVTADDALARYQHGKLDLGDIVRALKYRASARGDEGAEWRARELLKRIAEDRFNLAVVGQFSRGKSTLMNALLGHEFLPSGPRPTTSAVTTVRYGDTPRAIVWRAGANLPGDIAIDDLAAYVTRTAARRDRIVAAELLAPAELLRRGLCFVDTPGIGSAISANTMTTKLFLPEADAAIFVTSFDAPLTDGELELFDDLREHVGHIFVVINKLDLVGAAERDAVRAFVHETLAQRMPFDNANIFPVSALRALESRVAGDEAGVADSGLPTLEARLVRFIRDDKASEFLARTAVRAQRLIDREKIDERVAQLADRVPELRTRQAHDFDDHVANIRHRASTVTLRLQQRLDDELPQYIAANMPAWRTELMDDVIAQLDDVTSTSVDDVMPQAIARINHSIGQWRDQRVELLAAWVAHAGDVYLDELDRCCRAVEPAWYAAFDLAIPESDRHTRFIDVAPTVSASHAVDVARKVRGRRLLPAPRPRSQKDQVLAAAASAIDECAEELAVEAAAGAARWTARLADYAAQVIENEATRLRGHVRPDTRLDTVDLADIEARLADVRARFDAPREDATNVRANVVPRADLSCTVCQEIATALFDFLAHDQYLLATSDNRQIDHARAGGYCAFHTWRYQDLTSDVGMSAGYARLAETTGELLAESARTLQTSDELHDALERLITRADCCAACAATEIAEHRAVQRRARRPAAEAGDDAVPSLCLRHAAAILAANPSPPQSRHLVAVLAERLQRASEDMRAYALKRDALHHDLVSRDEANAYLVAAGILAGHPSLARPKRPPD